VTCEDAAFKWF